MDAVKAQDVVAVITSVGAYGGQLAAVFHNYSLTAERIPSGFEGGINILDATVAVLKQILTLVKSEVEGKKLFSEDGLTYVNLLARECANTLAKVERIIIDACLDRQERKAKRKQNKKAASKKLVVETNPLGLKLDEKAFLEKVESANWSWADDDIEDYMERLYELQLHLLLVFEVVSVGALSNDLTSGKVDIQSIVTSHKRINRTAKLIGIKLPKGQSPNRRRGSFSSLDSGSDSSTGSDSDNSSISPKKKKRAPFRCGPPPPPPGNPGFYGGIRRPGGPPGPPSTRGGPPPPPGPLLGAVTLPLPPPPPPPERHPGLMVVNENSVHNGKPPAYSEGQPGTNIVPVPMISQTNITSVSTPTLVEKATQNVCIDDRTGHTAKNEPTKVEESPKPFIAEGRLFKSPSNGFGFKFKSLFRSKESLAAEMRRTLNDSESRLVACVVQRHDLRQVPHSAFHTLEATHMKTILSQLNGSEWYKTFSSLDTFEHATVSNLLHPWIAGKVHERELVVLKVIEHNCMNAWVALLGELLKNRSALRLNNGRILLAIVREKFVNGKPLDEGHCRILPGPPPPHFTAPPPSSAPIPLMPLIRPPPMPYSPPRRTTISDLQGPPPPPWQQCPPGAGFPPGPCGPPRGPPGSPPRAVPFSPGPPSGPPPRNSSIRNSDIGPITDADANGVLTTFNEYTMRLADKIDGDTARSWSRVAITQENSERHLIEQRVNKFRARGGDVIEVKLRLTELQSSQVTRLMDDIRCCERDSRFEWTWVEMSLYNDNGEITSCLRNCNVKAHDWDTTGSANRMHLIAKRMLKPNYKPLDVYNALTRPPPRPPVQPTIIEVGPPRPGKKKGRYVSSSESDSDRSLYSSDSSVGHVRRQLRKYRARQNMRSWKGRRFYNDSDSDSDDSEDEDVIAVKVTLKSGEDVVKVLLGRWTSDGEVIGNGKGKMLSTNF